MANGRAMTALGKALKAPEDLFDFGTVLRSSNEDTVLVKLDDDVWVEISRSGIEGDDVTAHRLSMTQVVETVRDVSDSWEVSHNWKPAKTA